MPLKTTFETITILILNNKWTYTFILIYLYFNNIRATYIKYFSIKGFFICWPSCFCTSYSKMLFTMLQIQAIQMKYIKRSVWENRLISTYKLIICALRKYNLISREKFVPGPPDLQPGALPFQLSGFNWRYRSNRASRIARSKAEWKTNEFKASVYNNFSTPRSPGQRMNSLHDHI